jgi:hypothetical protein
MALTILETQVLECPRSAQHEMYYAQGDLTNLSAEQHVTFLVVSALPGDYAPTSGSLIGALNDKGVSVAAMALDKAAHYKNLDCWVSQPITGAQAGIEYDRILVYEPVNPSANAAKDVYNIIHAMQCFQNTTPTSFAMPLVSTGSGGANASDVLRMSFYALAQAGALYHTHFTQMTIAVYGASQAATLQPEFQSYQLAYNTLHLSTSMPGNYALYANSAWAWASSHSSNYSNLTKRQLFGIRMLTSSYSVTIDATLNTGSITSANFKALQPLFEAADSGLDNIEPNVGTTFVGLPASFTPFPTIPTKFYSASYLSSSKPAGSLYNEATYKMNIMGITSRDIRSISWNPDENEFMFQRGENFDVTAIANNVYTVAQIPKNYYVQVK